MVAGAGWGNSFSEGAVVGLAAESPPSPLGFLKNLQQTKWRTDKQITQESVVGPSVCDPRGKAARQKHNMPRPTCVAV